MIHATLGLDGAGGRVWDVIVIGAGPGGSLAARQIAVEDKRVLLIDRKTFPRPKVCGACLNGKALSILESVGLGDRLEQLGGVVLKEFEVRVGGRAVRLPLPAGKALSREVLDAAMIEGAIEVGVEFLPATSAEIEPGDGEEIRRLRLVCASREVQARARIVVVASGLNGIDLTRESGLRTRVSNRSRIGAGCVVSTFPDSYREGTIHMAMGRAGYVGLVRVEGGLLNVASAFERGFLKSSGGPASAAGIVLEEAGFAPVPAFASARWQGTVGLTRRTRPVAGQRLFLIGDAAGYVEPFTGEGMGAALTSARAVAPIVRRGVEGWSKSLANEWSREYHRLVGRGQIVCQGLVTASRHPWVAERALDFSALFPEVCRALIQLLNKPPAFIEAV